MKKTLSLSSMPTTVGPSTADNDADDAMVAAPAKPAVDPFQAKADMHTLMEAQKIKADKARHGRALSAAREHMARLQKVTKGE